MRTLEAKVLDPTHLELSEPIPFGSGQEVEISLDARGRHRQHDAPSRQTANAEAPAEATQLQIPGHSPPRRTRELSWRQAHGEELRAHAGEWVVLEGEEIVAHGENPPEVLEKAKRHGVDVPYIFYVEESAADVVQMGL